MDSTTNSSSYKQLILWQKAFELTKEVYHLTSLFPKYELYGLVSQLRRSAVSVVSNIAEGFSRKTLKERMQFVSVAFGSSSELETQLLLSKELKLAHPNTFKKSEDFLVEVRKILNHYILKTQKSLIPSP